MKTRIAMNEKISVVVICVKVIIYLLLYNLHGCNFCKIHRKTPVPVSFLIKAEYYKFVDEKSLEKVFSCEF